MHLCWKIYVSARVVRMSLKIFCYLRKKRIEFFYSLPIGSEQAKRWFKMWKSSNVTSRKHKKSASFFYGGRFFRNYKSQNSFSIHLLGLSGFLFHVVFCSLPLSKKSRAQVVWELNANHRISIGCECNEELDHSDNLKCALTCKAFALLFDCRTFYGLLPFFDYMCVCLI